MEQKQELVPEPIKICPTCGQEKPVRSFRGIHCRACRAKVDEALKRGRLAEQFNKALDDFQSSLRAYVSQTRGDAIDATHPLQLYASLLDRFGGHEALCDIWYEQIQQAMTKAPGSKTVLEQFWKLAHFAESAMKMREDSPSVAQLSEQDLNREVLRILGPKIIPMLKAVDPEAAAALVLNMGGEPEEMKSRVYPPQKEEDQHEQEQEYEEAEYVQNPDDPEDTFTFIPAEPSDESIIEESIVDG